MQRCQARMFALDNFVMAHSRVSQSASECGALSVYQKTYAMLFRLFTNVQLFHVKPLQLPSVSLIFSFAIRPYMPAVRWRAFVRLPAATTYSASCIRFFRSFCSSLVPPNAHISFGSSLGACRQCIHRVAKPTLFS